MKNQHEAYALLRLGLGINLFLHGLVRFGSNWEKFQGWILGTFAESPLPMFMVKIAGSIIPPAEFILGTLLILGFKTRYALIGASFLFINLMFGMSLIQKWDVVGSHMMYLLISTLLLFLHGFNAYALDKHFSKGQK